MVTEFLLPPGAVDRTADDWAAAARFLPRATTPRLSSDSTSASFSRAAAEQGVGDTALDALIDRLPIGVLLTDASGCVTYANAEALRLDPLDLPPLACAMGRAVFAGESTRNETMELPTTRGPRRWVSVDVVPVRRAGSRDPNGAVLLVCETTAQQQAAEWLPLVESLARL